MMFLIEFQLGNISLKTKQVTVGDKRLSRAQQFLVPVLKVDLALLLKKKKTQNKER